MGLKAGAPNIRDGMSGGNGLERESGGMEYDGRVHNR